MKVLTVNCVAKRHSTGKIIDSIAKDLSDTCDTYMCYETGDKPDDPTMYRIAGWLEYRFYYALGRLLGLKYTTGFGSTFRLIRHIKKVSGYRASALPELLFGQYPVAAFISEKKRDQHRRHESRGILLHRKLPECRRVHEVSDGMRALRLRFR